MPNRTNIPHSRSTRERWLWIRQRETATTRAARPGGWLLARAWASLLALCLGAPGAGVFAAVQAPVGPTPENRSVSSPGTARLEAVTKLAVAGNMPEPWKRCGRFCYTLLVSRAPQETSPVAPPQDSERPKEDWSVFRGDAHGTGVARTKLPKQIDVVWQFEVPNGSFEGTPAIVKSQKPRVVIGDLDGRLLALDLENGQQIWETQLASELGFVTAPAIAHDRIYLGDIDGIFHCFDANGKKLWSFTTDAEIDSSANFYRDQVLFGSQDTNLYALNRTTGELTWRVATADQVRCSATVIENRGFVAGCDGALHVIDLDAGRETGSAPIESPTGVTPAARGEHVYVGTEQAGFYCINWRTTEIVWHFDAPNGGLSTRSSPALKGDQVVFGASNRRVYSLHAATGQVQWETLLKAKVESSPIIVGDRVFVGSTDGRFYALDLGSGQILWQKQLNGGIIGSPAAAYGHLVVATQRGVVYCLGRRTAPDDSKHPDSDHPLRPK